MTLTSRLITGDNRDVLKTLPDESVQCVITSPPYWGLRDYGVEGQIGLEPSPQEYVAQMVDVFREVKRVLRSDGTLWLNMGDSYAATRSYQVSDNKHIDVGNDMSSRVPDGLKPKDLIGVPWRLAFALQDDGWWLRSDIIWAKPNPMPESVTDRPTKAHEYIFLLTKSARYYYDADAVSEKSVSPDGSRAGYAGYSARAIAMGRKPSGNEVDGKHAENNGQRNLRSVWNVATHPFSQAHFATFPPKLIEPCVKAGTSEKGQCPECGAPWVREVERTAMEIERTHNHPSELRTRTSGTMTKPPTSKTLGWQPSCAHNSAPVPQVILDPFAGAGTTGLVATRMNRQFIGIELNPEYAEMARQRIVNDAPLFMTGAVSDF